MKYFIGYAAEGEITNYYKTITSDLASRFGIMNLSERVPAHLTLVYPNESNSIDIVLERIKSFILDKNPIPFTINGFGEFTGEDGTIFLSPVRDQVLQSFIKEAITTIASAADYTRYDDEFHLHMSVARHLDPELSESIWKYLKTLPSPKFELKFNNISVFEFTNRWDLKYQFQILT